MLRWFLLTIALLCFAPASAQLTTTGVGGGGFGGAAAGYFGPGDVVSGAYFWVGFRGYNGADTSPAANVCLPSDTTCADLTLSSGNVVVPGSLSTCNITTVICTVKTMYNKGSGVNLDITNATIASRPTFRPAMASNGCVSTAVPCMLFTAASSQRLNSAGLVTQAQPITFSIVFNSAAAAGDMFSSGALLYRNAANSMALYAGVTFGITAADNSFHAMQAVFRDAVSAGTSIGYVDGTSTTGSAGTVGSNGNAVSIGQNIVSAFWGGYIQEAGAWPSGFTAPQQSQMNTNQHSASNGWNF